MNMLKHTIIVMAVSVAMATFAEDIGKYDSRMAESNAVVDTNGVKWIDGKFMPVEGRWTYGNMKHFYCRLPDTVTTNVNGGVRAMRFHTAGIQMRFKTDSNFIMVKYISRSKDYNGGGNLTGVARSGWDMYRYDKTIGKWRFVNTSHNSSWTAKPKERVKRVGWKSGDECIINLPLYDGVDEMSIGIAPTAKIEALGGYRSGVKKPVVFYGTSITHGASASRPGLAFVNKVGRDLEVPVYNLGFSGCGRMEYEMSEHVAKIDASCYVLDCLWNMSTLAHPDRRPGCENKVFEENYEPFIRNLRAKRPNVPIIMAGQCDVFCGGPNEKERLMKALYDKLIAEGWKELYFLPNAKMHHDDYEGTVDGCHPNDWGMMSMAEAYGGAVKEALKL